MTTTRWPLPRVVGAAGYIDSGKSTFANLLTPYGYRVASLSTELCEALAVLDPVVAGPAHDPVRWNDVIAWYGYEGAKEHPHYGTEVRRLLQVMGTEVGRGMFGETVWSDRLFAKRQGDELIVIPDIRFPSDVAAVRRRGGIVLRIRRPGHGKTSDHVGESALDGVPLDLVVVNSGLPEQMLEQLEGTYTLPEWLL